jgi:hypothetical protein
MTGKSLGERAVQLALRAYPRWWRDRYGPDQEALVEDLTAEPGRRAWLASDAWGLAGSFVVGAVRARFSGSGMPAVSDLWQRRARAAIIAASLPAAIGAGVAVLLMACTAQDFTPGSGSGSTSGAIQLSAAGQVVSWENLLLAVLSLAFIVQLAWVAAGLSRQMRLLAPPRRRVLVSAVTLVPVVAIGLGILLLIEASHLRPVISGSEGVVGRVTHVWYSYRGHPLAAKILFCAGWTGILGGWLGGSLLLATMAARRRFPIEALTAGLRSARAVTVLQGGVALCAVALAVTVTLQPPTGSNGGMVFRSDLGPWAPVLCAALVAGALITWSATRAAGQALTRATSMD